jgi:hypothetical protein
MKNEKIKRLSTKPFLRRLVRIILIIPAGILVCVLILVGVLLAYSPGKPEPFLDENGSRLTAPCLKNPKKCRRSCGRMFWPGRIAWPT